jgi:prepilin-type N-terminal cleavage/methylation domain-containing protein
MPRNGSRGSSRIGERGFTLIEILVVLLIIVVLSAIAFPLFVNQRTKAQDTEAKTALRTAAGAIEVYHQDHNTFTGADLAALVKIEPALAEARNLGVDATDAGYTLTVDSASGTQGGGPFTLKHTVGVPTERTCATAGQGGCSDAGRW